MSSQPIYNAISWIVKISDYILKTVSNIRTALFSMNEIIFGVFKDIMSLFVNILTKFQYLIVSKLLTSSPYPYLSPKRFFNLKPKNRASKPKIIMSKNGKKLFIKLFKNLFY